MNILGISASHSDSGACLLQDGRILCTMPEEFFINGRQKTSFPIRSLTHCLQEGKIEIDDLDLIAFCDKPFVQGQKILMTDFSRAPVGLRSFLKDMIVWITQQVWMKQAIFKTTGFKGEILFSGRYESLAAKAFFPSPFPEAAFIFIINMFSLRPLRLCGDFFLVFYDRS